MGNDTHLVEDKDEVFVGSLSAQVLLHQPGPCAHGVPCIQHLHHHVGGVDHLVQLIPDALTLAGLEGQAASLPATP